jgi:hypothetical protein
MNSQGKNDYPHIVLHLFTGLVALTALALALSNYRETRKIGGPDRAVPVKVSALPKEAVNLAAPDRSKKKNGGDERRSATAARTKKKTAAAPARKKSPAESKPVPPARERGLDEIVTDLVKTVID